MSIFGDVLGIFEGPRAAHSISDANIAAEHGVLDATQNGQQGISNAANAGQAGITHAVAAGNAPINKTLADTVSPYASAGAEGVGALKDYALSKPQFNFNLNDYLNSPAMKFQMDQGTNAIQNHAAALGTGSSGQTLKDLTSFGQGLASTYYNQAFGQAKDQFQTNQNTTLANLSTLVNAGEVGNNQTLNAQSGIAGRDLQGAETGAGMGLQGAETGARLGMEGSKLAGDYAVNAGQAHAGGIMSQANAIGGLGSDIGGLLTGGWSSIGDLVSQGMGG